MTRLEKNAWLEIVAAGLGAIAYAILYFRFGFEIALAAFAFLALPSFGKLASMRSASQPAPILDERDQAILAKSSLVGYGVFWLAFVGGTMGLWLFDQGRGSIPVAALPTFPVAGCAVLMLARSVATLLQYARGR